MIESDKPQLQLYKELLSMLDEYTSYIILNLKIISKNIIKNILWKKNNFGFCFNGYRETFSIFLILPIFLYAIIIID